MFGEHIEEMIALFKREKIPLDPDSIAGAVLDIALAQGLVQEHELYLAHQQVAGQVRYMLKPSEVVARWIGRMHDATARDAEFDTETGYALDDPKHPTYHERMSGLSDDR